MDMYYSVWICFCIVFVVCEAAIKSWQADTNFDNANNWSPTQTPCNKDYVLFDSNKAAVVYLTTKTEFSEMLLPMNGEFIFGDDAELGVTASERKCERSVVKYQGANPRSWHDPENWLLIKSDYLLNYDLSHPLPVPHVDRIPCQGDIVIFERLKSFQVHILVDEVSIQSISINGQVMDNQSLADIIQDSSHLIFRDKGKIVLENFTCDDESGCICSNSKPEILSRICSSMTPRCPAPECADPIQPEGHCCQMCGSLMRLDYGNMFKLDVLKTLIQVYIDKTQFSEVTAYLSKTGSNKIQVVFLDTPATRGSAVHIVNDLTEALQTDHHTVNLYDVNSIESKSTHLWTKIEPGALSSGVGAGSVIGILLGIFFFLFLPVGIFIFYKKHKLPGFSFARFDADKGKVELELGTTPHEELNPPAATDLSVEKMGKGFDNPMFGSSSTKSKGGGTKSQRSYTQEMKVKPLYKDEEIATLALYDDDDDK